jgi:nucleotide-binding universal stress UspA family protein
MAFQRILVALDGSPSADQLVPALRPLLARPGTTVFLARVAAPDDQAAAQAHLAHVRARCQAAGIRAHALVAEGEPGSALPRLAEEHRCELLVVSTHSRSGPSRWILGSVAAEVIRTARRPVLVVSADALRARPAPDAAFAFARICVPLDGSLAATHVLDPVARLARAFDSEVTLFHATCGELVVGSGTLLAHGGAGGGEAMLAPHRTTLTKRGIRVRTDVSTGGAAEGIVEATHRTDLVVMTTRDRGATPRALEGSCAEAVLRDARTPLLLVPVPLAATAAAATARPAAGDRMPEA